MSEKAQSIVEDIRYYVDNIITNTKAEGNSLYRLRRAADKEERNSLIDSIDEMNSDVLDWAEMIDNLAYKLESALEEEDGEA